MSREQDKKIAEWLGWKFSHEKSAGQLYGPWYWTNPPQQHGNRVILPKFTEYDANAITLLPVLVDRGYLPKLAAVHGGCWQVEIYKAFDLIVINNGASIAAAITAAVLLLLEKEQ